MEELTFHHAEALSRNAGGLSETASRLKSTFRADHTKPNDSHGKLITVFSDAKLAGHGVTTPDTEAQGSGLLATLEGAEVTFHRQDLAARIPQDELPGLFASLVQAVPVVEQSPRPSEVKSFKKLAIVTPRVLHTPQTLAGVYNIRPNNGNITPQ
jgi:hypothetical protein